MGWFNHQPKITLAFFRVVINDQGAFQAEGCFNKQKVERNIPSRAAKMISQTCIGPTKKNEFSPSIPIKDAGPFFFVQKTGGNAKTGKMPLKAVPPKAVPPKNSS